MRSLKKLKHFKLWRHLALAQKQAGFSLMEILIALTLLVVAGTFVAGKIFDSYNEGLQSSATITMQNFSDRLNEFKRHCHFYPEKLEDLVTKPTGRECKRYSPNGYLDEIPQDPWSSDYQYESDGKTYTITSLGEDGEAGGEGFGKDLTVSNKRGGSASAGPTAPAGGDGGGAGGEAEEAPEAAPEE